MNGKIILALAFLAIAGCTSTPTFQTGEDAEVSFDGLTRVDDTIMDAVWARTDIDLTSFRKIMFERIGVEFRAIEGGPYSGRGGTTGGSVSSMTRNQTYFRLDEATKELVISEISGAFASVIATSDVYEVVEEPGYDVLLIRVGLLDIVSRVPPERIGRSEIFLDSIGDATIVLEVRDSMSNSIFLRAADRDVAGRSGTMTASNRVTNAAEVRRLGQSWARGVKDGLEKLMTEGVSP
jgi:hypothetical protein